MARYIPDDRRYMSYEQRAAEGDERFIKKERPVSERPAPAYMLETKLAAYEARRAGDTATYERLVADLLHWRSQGWRI